MNQEEKVTGDLLDGLTRFRHLPSRTGAQKTGSKVDKWKGETANVQARRRNTLIADGKEGLSRKKGTKIIGA